MAGVMGELKELMKRHQRERAGLNREVESLNEDIGVYEEVDEEAEQEAWEEEEAERRAAEREAAERGAAGEAFEQEASDVSMEDSSKEE
jgi:hypothetical protein